MKILIADDELLIRKTLHKVFERQGHEVKSVADGDEALQLWPSFQPQLVILDVLMPNVGGVEVLEKIKGLGFLDSKDLAVVMISAYSAGGTKEDFILKGATDFVRKPFDDVYDFAKHCLDLVKEPS